MRRPALIHQDLLGSLGDFFSSTCTIQSKVVTSDAYKDEVETWSTLHSGIHCSIAYPGKVKANKIYRPDETYTLATHVVALAGYYPDVTTSMRAIVGGLTLDIMTVVFDSQHKTTELFCEVVT